MTELDLVLEAVEERWVKAIVAHVHCFQAGGGGEGSCDDRDRLRPEPAARSAPEAVQK